MNKTDLKYGDLCWAWNKSSHFNYPSIATFERMLNNKYDTDIGTYDYCEKFIGKMPSILTKNGFEDEYTNEN